MGSSPTTPHEAATGAPVTVTRAVAKAVEATPHLSRMTPADRAELLEAVADALDTHADELIALAGRETGLDEARLTGEVARTTMQLRSFSGVLREGSFLEVVIDHADRTRTPPQPDLRRQLVPLGPVAVFTASNFPFAFSVAGGDTASALAAGCPVIVKGHPGHPELSRRTASLVDEALHAAGAPLGTVTHVEGFEAGRHLVLHPQVKAVAFTGSLAGGRALFDLASGREEPIPFYGELSSINPVVVMPGAAAARASHLAAGLAGSFTLGVGQFCTKPGVVFVPAETDLTTELRRELSGATPARMLVDRILSAFRQSTGELADVDGVEFVLGSLAEPGATGATPIVFAADTEVLLAEPEKLLEERFGPSVLLVRYSSPTALREALQVLPGALTASMHAEPHEFDEVRTLVDQLRAIAGRLVFDGWPTGVAVTWSMQHGGPWPATTNSLHTSVGATGIRRFMRPVAYQDAPETLLPPALREDNPLGVPRRIDGAFTTGPRTNDGYEPGESAFG